LKLISRIFFGKNSFFAQFLYYCMDEQIHILSFENKKWYSMF